MERIIKKNSIMGKKISRVLFFTLLLMVQVYSVFGFDVQDVRCALIQFSDHYRNEVDLDADRLELYIREAQTNGAKLIIAPENCLYRYDPWAENNVTMLTLANSFNDLIARFSRLAAELCVCLVFGTREPSEDSDKPTYQSAVFIDHHGNLLKIYRKRIPSNSENSFTKSGGNDWQAFDTPVGRVFMQVCKDMDGDGYTNNMPVDIDLLIGINKDPDRGWVKVDAGCAKAECYGIGVNFSGSQGGSIGGNSGFVHPDGNMISEAGPGNYGENEGVFYEILPLPVDPSLLSGIPDGQIIIDPDHPNRMVYQNTYVNGKLKPVVLIGPGDPEDMFYNGKWNDVDMLINKGARCTYVMAVLGDFGGGDPGSGTTLDNNLNTWDDYITSMENAGIVTVFFFLDDMKAPPDNWIELVDKCVAKLKHHRLLIWSVAEEYGEALTMSQVDDIALRIKSQDDKNHIVAVHQNSGTDFHFNGYVSLDMFAMQYNGEDADDIHNSCITAYNDLNDQYILNLAEIADHANKDRTTVRRWNWAAIMGGASMVQVLGMGRASGPSSDNEQEKYDDCALAMDFFESCLAFNSLEPDDSIAYGATMWVLADPGNAYILYTTSTGSMGVKNLNAGNYRLKWFDCVNGEVFYQNISTHGGDISWVRPSGIGNEAALYIENRSDPIPTPIPTEMPSPTPSPSTNNQGDVNNDNLIDIIDALLIAQYYVGLDVIINEAQADTNCDGSIDIIDALLIAQYYVGLIAEFC